MKRLSIMCLFAVLVMLGSNGYAVQFTVTQLTNDSAVDGPPSLYNGTIAWSEDSEIYYWDGSTVTQITNDSAVDGSLSLYDGTIAWSRGDGEDWEIFYVTLTSPPILFQVTAPLANQVFEISEGKEFSFAVEATGGTPPLAYEGLSLPDGSTFTRRERVVTARTGAYRRQCGSGS